MRVILFSFFFFRQNSSERLSIRDTLRAFVGEKLETRETKNGGGVAISSSSDRKLFTQERAGNQEISARKMDGQ